MSIKKKKSRNFPSFNHWFKRRILGERGEIALFKGFFPLKNFL